MPGCSTSGTPPIAPCCFCCGSPGMGPRADAGLTGVVPLYVETGVEVDWRSGGSTAPAPIQGPWSWDWCGVWLALL